MNCAIRNSNRLIQDAQLLFEHNKFASAVSLAILAIEESGKIPILRRLACVDSNEDAKAIWKNYRSHRAKNLMWIFPQMVADGAKRLRDFAPMFDKNADHSATLDSLKQVSLYSDCLGHAHWSEPTKNIDRELAETLLTVANAVCKTKEVTTTEIELWVKHMKNSLNGTQQDAEAALARWYGEMKSLGLTTYSNNEFENFLSKD